MIRAGDRLFQDSPDIGEPACRCSRCGGFIAEPAVPVRVFVDRGLGGEYRFHPRARKPMEPDDLDATPGGWP